MTKLHRSLIFGCSMLALAACGPEEIASPGAGGNITINNPAPTPTPTPAPTPTPTPTGVVAGACPTIAGGTITDSGVLTIPQGTVRICTLPDRITASSTLPYISGVAYELSGRVDVGTDGGAAPSAADTNVTLTIEPGVTVFGGTGVSWLAVNRGNRINAQGTPTSPIIFTSRQNLLGSTTDDSSGQWGGVVLLGRAQITDCLNAGATPGTDACERDTEGAANQALFGGTTNTDNSGTMRYVQIRYSGYVLSANNELQSLTLEGIGSGTTIDHIMSVNSSDDAVEIFGGHARMKNFIAVGQEDDCLDTDTGTKAYIQYALCIQRSGKGDAMIESDSDNSNDGNTPRQNTYLSNFTFIQRNNTGSDGTSMLLRGGTDYSAVNGVVYAPTQTCLKISRDQTFSSTVNAGIDEAGSPVFASVVMECNATPFAAANGAFTATDVQNLFNGGTNNNASFTVSGTLTSTFVNGAAEDAITKFNASSLDSWFDNPSNIGALYSGNSTWFNGWTCDSTAASFGQGKNCAASPVT